MNTNEVMDKFKKCNGYNDILALAEEIKNDPENEMKQISKAMMVILCLANTELKRR